MNVRSLSHWLRPAAGKAWLSVLAVLIFSGHALASGPVPTRGVGEGLQPQRPGLSPAQRRLMARRAAEVRAARDAVGKAVGAPTPEQIGTGTIEIQGRPASSRVVELDELPDGRWRAVVEVTLPVEPEAPESDVVGEVLTDYLLFRAELVRSREKCMINETCLQLELKAAVESARQAIQEALETCRADMTVIDRALADLETETIKRLSVTTTTTTSSPIP
ncbi:MAG: hypothetical protein JXQ73_12565 [Phycisphaerae bacterium]|nr:hypothetical protein [Phycisphaerae bacterium]